MRGKLQRALSANGYDGITPADAGKTHIPHGESCRLKDHPRGCGENFPIEYNAVPVIGSPPRMRGKLISVYIIVGYCRITPADAGKT